MNINAEGKLDFTVLKYVPEDVDSRRLVTDDVLFNNTNSPELIGKTAWVSEQGEGKAFSNHMTRIRFNDSVVPKFGSFQLFYLWGARYFLHRCVKHVNQASVSSRDLEKSLPFVSAPVNEQHRIVAKIEELFSELDKGVESLITAREQLKVYRQALLKHAFEGKLTEQWRAEHADQLETADQLLVRIKKEREQRYQEQLAEWEKVVEEWEARGKKDDRPAKPRKLKELPPITNKEIDELPSLPGGWRWIKINKIHNHEQNAVKAGPFGSALKKEFYVPSGYKIYGQEQVISGDWAFGDYFVNEEKYLELENCKVAPNDILISLVGTVGKVLVLPDEILPGIINPRLIKISPNPTAYNPTFFKHYFESHFIKDLYKLKTHGATMDVLNLGIIQELPFPLCPTEEQEAIVNILEMNFSIIDRLDKTIDDELDTSIALKQSILKQAFSGKLVPQDPNDEPASELLARIKAKRDEGQQQAKRKPRKTKKRKEVITMADLIEVMKNATDWMSAQEVFRKCGIADGSETDAIEKIYEELRGYVKENKIAVERRGEEDWLRLAQGV